MQLENFLCCMPLAWGVITTGLIWGIADFVVGTVGWHMVIEDEYSDWLVEFFRQMPVGYCVAGFSFVFYLMAIVHFMLAYGAYTDNHLFVGAWLLVSFTVFLMTLIFGLLSSFAVLRIAIDAYCLIMVKSYYETLIAATSDADWVVEESSDEYDEDEV